MRVLPYFNNISHLRQSQRPVPVREPASGQADASPTKPVSEVRTPGRDEFIPSSPVSGVVLSYNEATAGGSEQTDTVIKSGNYSFYQLNGGKQESETGGVGGKLDLKG